MPQVKLRPSRRPAVAVVLAALLAPARLVARQRLARAQPPLGALLRAWVSARLLLPLAWLQQQPWVWLSRPVAAVVAMAAVARAPTDPE